MHDNNVNLVSEIYGYSNGKTENSSILTGPLWFDDNKFLHALPCTADTWNWTRQTRVFECTQTRVYGFENWRVTRVFE